MEETNPDNAHCPLKVLCPRCYDRWQIDGRHANESLGLEIAEERECVGSDVSSSIGMSETGSNSRSDECKTCNYGRDPADCLLIDRLSIRKLCFDTSDARATVRHVNVDLDFRIKIRNSECNA